MAVYTSQQSTIKYTPTGGTITTLPGVIDADITITQDTIDVTEMSSRDRKYIQGIRSGSANLTMFYDQGSHGFFETALKDGAEVTFKFTLHAQSGGNVASYEVACLVKDFQPKIAVNDVIKATVSLQFTGEVTIA